MAPRVARSNLPTAKPKNSKQKNKKRSLNAYATAQKLVKEKGPKSHRLGEVEDDEPRQKRRREESDEDDESEAEVPQKKRRVPRDGDDNIEYGSDSEGHEWTMGGMAEDGDDSDLDSDEAFGESDEERFAGFTFRGSSGGKGKSKKKASLSRDVDLNEDDESGEDSDDSQDDEGLGLGNDAIDLAAMLDDNDEEMLGGKDKTLKDMGEDSASDEEEEDEEGYTSESEGEEEDEDEEDMELRAASMRDRIEAMDPASRKTSASQPIADVTEDDFLEGTSLATERKSKKKSSKPTTLAAPLPKRQQDRLDREVASQKAKEQLDRWRDTVTRNRRAEFLNFPLQDPTDQPGTVGKEKFVPANQQAPRNELEESIHRIMEESGLATKPNEEIPDDVGDEETALLKAEELAEKKLPVEEVMRRRADLRKARELLFREEIKAKRIAKIKSKSYRRVHRKERERRAEREQELMEGLGADGMDEEDKEKQDRRRAQARISTKHKDSKWAKSLKQTNRTVWDEDARDGAVEQARRNEELKKRIAGADISDEDGSDLPSEDDDEDDDDEVSMQQLEGLKSNDSAGSSRLANLKFMKASDERRRKANDEDVERLRKELAIADGDEEESDVDGEGLGRAIFGPGKLETKPVLKEKRLEFEAPEGSGDEDELDGGDAEELREKPEPQSKETAKPKSILKKTDKVSGPLANGKSSWLKEPESKEEAQTSTTGWLNAKKAKSRRSNVDEDIITDVLAPNKTPSAKPEPVEPTSNGTADSTDGWTVVKYNNDSDSDAEPSNPLTSKQTLQQRAFAGDDVQIAFEAEKADMAASEDEKEISNHLPGWGSWTGSGLSKSIRKANARQKHNPLWKTKVDGVKQADRKDADLKNVIISEKQDRKGKKYLASQLPHEFETKEQYERSRRLPMGPEWTTKEVHQRMTRPRVVVKKGVNVRALERPVA